MSVLSDRDILREVGVGLEVDGPFVKASAIQPASLDLRLNGAADALLGYSTWDMNYREPIDPENPPEMVIREWAGANGSVAGPHYVLRPGHFILGSTEEVVRLGTALAAQFDGRSTLARLGLFVHLTAGWIDPGYRGRITIEMYNAAPRPILLRPLMPIGQIVFHRLTSPAMIPYGDVLLTSRYQGSLGTVQARTAKPRGPERPVLTDAAPIDHPV